MKRVVWIFVSVVVVLALAAVAAARDPRLEKLALRASDTRDATGAVVRLADLGAGWRKVAFPSRETPPPACVGYRPDFSRFTVTGRARSGFASPVTKDSLLSAVDMFASDADARGDFALTTAASARCIGADLQRQAAAGNPPGATFKLLSARRVNTPNLAERAATYHIVSQLTRGTQRVRAHIDAIIFQRGRSIGGVFFIGANRSVPHQQPIAARVASRLP